jgi:hypothetical protein
MAASFFESHTITEPFRFQFRSMRICTGRLVHFETVVGGQRSDVLFAFIGMIRGQIFPLFYPVHPRSSAAKIHLLNADHRPLLYHRWYDWYNWYSRKRREAGHMGREMVLHPPLA